MSKIKNINNDSDKKSIFFDWKEKCILMITEKRGKNIYNNKKNQKWGKKWWNELIILITRKRAKIKQKKKYY